LLVGGDDDDRAVLSPRGEEVSRELRRGGVEARAVEHAERSVGRVRGQRAAQRGTPCLAVHLHLEVAIARRERDAAAGPVRRARRPGACSTRALLAPGLGAAPGHEPTRLRAARRRALLVQLRPYGLVHEMRLQLGGEDRLLERHVLRLLAGGVQQRCLGGGHYRRASSRTSTNPFLGPGTAPFTSSRFRSASMPWITRPTCVARLPPRRPGRRVPLKTRDGVAD